jgi:hypothetical protein
MRFFGVLSGLVGLSLLCVWEGQARADDSSVTVGFAEPPPNQQPIVRTSDRDLAFIAQEPEGYRSPVRFDVGPGGITTGRGFGYGVVFGASFGKGTVGFRLSGTWLRGEARSSDTAQSMPATGESFGQYLSELTLDLHKRGPLHPVVAPGIGLVHVGMPNQSGNAGVGTVRIGLEHSLNLEDADVRLGGSVLGALVGPRDDEVKDLKGYVVMQLGVTVGF